MTRSRVRVYLVVRLLAAGLFLLGALVLPHGVPAALVVVAAGVLAVGSCLWTNAGGPGERAGARAQNRWFDSVTPPQGDWPPYEEPVDVPPVSSPPVQSPPAGPSVGRPAVRNRRPIPGTRQP